MMNDAMQDFILCRFPVLKKLTGKNNLPARFIDAVKAVLPDIKSILLRHRS